MRLNETHLWLAKMLSKVLKTKPRHNRLMDCFCCLIYFLFQLFELLFLFFDDKFTKYVHNQTKRIKEIFCKKKKCVNTLLNFVSFETRPTWCCYNANVQVCSSISKMYYFRMIILYCYQSYTTYYSIMIRLLVLWLIILHDTLLSKHNKPISLYKANELIFVA